MNFLGSIVAIIVTSDENIKIRNLSGLGTSPEPTILIAQFSIKKPFPLVNKFANKHVTLT